MNTTARSVISGATLFGLLAFLGYAITTRGLTSDAAILGFSLVTMQGLAEIAIISYAPFSSSRARMKIAPAPRRVETTPQRVPVGAGRPVSPKARNERSRVLVA